MFHTYSFQWRVLLNNVSYLQLPVAGPSEQRYVLTASSGGSLNNVTYLHVPVRAPSELCYVLLGVIKHQEIMEKYRWLKNICVHWITALEAITDVL